jgi:hypothetical protein
MEELTTPPGNEPVKMVEVPEEQLKALLLRIKDSEAEVTVLKKTVFSILNLLGLADDSGKVNQVLLEDESRVMPTIIKGVGGIMTLMGQSQVPIMGKASKAKLEKKFEFLKDLLPLIKKYGV